MLVLAHTGYAYHLVSLSKIRPSFCLRDAFYLSKVKRPSDAIIREGSQKCYRDSETDKVSIWKVELEHSRERAQFGKGILVEKGHLVEGKPSSLAEIAGP